MAQKPKRRSNSCATRRRGVGFGTPRIAAISERVWSTIREATVRSGPLFSAPSPSACRNWIVRLSRRRMCRRVLDPALWKENPALRTRTRNDYFGYSLWQRPAIGQHSAGSSLTLQGAESTCPVERFGEVVVEARGHLRRPALRQRAEKLSVACGLRASSRSWPAKQSAWSSAIRCSRVSKSPPESLDYSSKALLRSALFDARKSNHEKKRPVDGHRLKTPWRSRSIPPDS